MISFRHKSTSPRSGGNTEWDALRQAFQAEAAAQRNRIPSARSVLLAARLEAQARRRSRADALATSIRPLLLSVLAGLLCAWWGRLAAMPQESAGANEPWLLVMVLTGLMLALTFGYTRILLRAI